jgi:hypothetical protein
MLWRGSHGSLARRLLLFNGHGSHTSAKFRDLCKENNIYTLYMPPYSSHKLQLLNVSCFLPLKVAYSSKIKGLMRCHINYITELEFLLAFKAAFYSKQHLLRI